MLRLLGGSGNLVTTNGWAYTRRFRVRIRSASWEGSYILVLRPNTRGILESVVARILAFMVSFGQLSTPNLFWHLLILSVSL